MSASFPINPTLGQTYSYGGNTWTWTASGWNLTTHGNDPDSVVDTLSATFSPLMPSGSSAMTNGLALFPRHAPDASISVVSGRVSFSFFTADKSFTASKVRARSRGTAAASVTLIRFGLYSVAADGAGTLVASTANDTALFAATFTEYTKNLSATYDVVQGQRYAAGWLVVATTPGVYYSVPPAYINVAQSPRTVGDLSALSDLPASFTDAGLGGNASTNIATTLLTAGAT